MRTASNAFNADEDNGGAPELTIGGAVYRGRVLSILEWFAFKERMDAVPSPASATSEAELAERLAARQVLMLEFLRAVFAAAAPDDPIAALETLGLVAIARAFNAFFSHQLHALGLVPVQLPTAVPEPPAAPTTKRDGTDSPDRTMPGPSASENDSPTS